MAKGINVPYGEPLMLELQAFIDSIKNGTQPPISGEEGLRALEAGVQCLVKGGLP